MKKINQKKLSKKYALMYKNISCNIIELICNVKQSQNIYKQLTCNTRYPKFFNKNKNK